MVGVLESISSREELSHRPPPFRRPSADIMPNRPFCVFFFDFLFGPLLNASFSVMKPKTDPNWTPNRPKIQPQTLPKSMLCCESPTLEFCKPSHTFARFCCSRRLENRPQIVSKSASILNALQKRLQIAFFPIFNRLGFQHGSNMGPPKPPKIGPTNY